jgi:O-antigen ligase
MLTTKLRAVSRFLWALVLISLPVTSFRYFPFLGKETMVRPLAFFPLALLVVVLTWRILRGDLRPRLNSSLVLLGLFLAAAAAATAWGWSFGMIPMHGQNFCGRAIRAVITLLGGLVFFLSVIFMNQDEDDVRFTLRWMYAGLAVSVLWSGLQMIAYLTGTPPIETLSQIQKTFSTRRLLDKARVAGFAFEPSWLANQLAVVYLPWLTAALFSGYRVFKRRWLEPLLLAAVLVTLLMTFSRGGILMSAAAILITFILTQGRRMKSWLAWFTHPFRAGSLRQRVVSLSVRIATAAAAISVLVGAFLVLSTNDYFAKLWRSTQRGSIVEYVIDNYAGPRLGYAVAGWEIYTEHPLTGIGLGASGMQIYDHIPDWADPLASEISGQLTTKSWVYPNPKNLYIRLLAETGLIGFTLYLLFWLSILGLVIRWLGKSAGVGRFVGIAGLFLWFVLIMFNFTQDSFIDPNQWIGIGILLGLTLAGNFSSKQTAELPE